MYFIELEERILSLQIRSAKERCQKILMSQPELLQRASLAWLILIQAFRKKH